MMRKTMSLGMMMMWMEIHCVMLQGPKSQERMMRMCLWMNIFWDNEYKDGFPVRDVAGSSEPGEEPFPVQRPLANRKGALVLAL